MRNDRRHADAAAVAAGRIGRLETAIRSAITTLEAEHGQRRTRETFPALYAALIEGAQTTAPPSTEWTECTRCGDAYVSDKEGCVYKDKTCPMKGTRP